MHKAFSFFFSFITVTIIGCQITSKAEAKVLSIFLTWQGEETHNNITVNYITEQNIQGQVLYSKLSSPNISQTQQGQKVELPGRLGYLQRIELTGLEADQDYQFAIRQENGLFSKNLKFKTMPLTGGTIRFMQGGDMGTSAKVVSTTTLAQDKDPQVILIGGDIAYANGLSSNYRRWRDWFNLMNEVMVNEDGYIIPLVAAVGNHENNSLSGSLDQEAPFYAKLFTVHSKRSYHLKKFSDHTVVFVLDSGHVTRHSDQVAWLEQNMQRHQQTSNLLALYHVPLYPSNRSYSGSQASKGRTFWLPLFDRYGLDMAFENHDHTLKRTKMLKDGNPVSQGGTIFVGDGCWGRAQRDAKQRSYLQVSMEANHVWMVTASAGRLEAQALGKSQVYDEFTLNSLEQKLISSSP